MPMSDLPIINKDNAGGDWCIVVVAEMDHSDVVRSPMANSSVLRQLFDVHIMGTPVSQRRTSSRVRVG